MNIKDELEKSIPVNITLTENEKATIRYRVRHPRTSNFYLKPVVVFALFIMITVVLAVPVMLSIVKEENTPQSNSNHSSHPLTEEQKQQYYEQYKKIVKKANEQKVGSTIGLSPFEEFNHWVTPEKFKKEIQSMLEADLKTEREEIAARSSDLEPAVTDLDGETTKPTYIYIPNIIRKIEVTAKFKTQYNAELDRNIFVGVDNVSTQFAKYSGPGTWKQTSYKASLVDGGKKYKIRIEGIFSLSNISNEKAFTIEFNCDEFGGIY